MISFKFNNRNQTPSKIICVGKNYIAHTEEMGDKDLPKEPVIFLKPNSSVVYDTKTVNIPENLGVLHHEVELCLLIGKTGRNIDENLANDYFKAACVGIDFTLREKQASLKKSGHPWEISKGFDSSAVFGEFKEIELKDLLANDIKLNVNGIEKQSSVTSKMIFSPETVLSFVSRYMTVNEGDILMMGTPSGVGPIGNNDMVKAEIKGLPVLQFRVIRDL